ncbi:MAG TPA: hypothetical protein VF104_12670, partial [Burkholderiales bacterium]
LVRQLDEGSGVIVFSDICGATPCNIGCRLTEPGRVELVAGVNLPMLLWVFIYRSGRWRRWWRRRFPAAATA